MTVGSDGLVYARGPDLSGGPVDRVVAIIRHHLPFTNRLNGCFITDDHIRVAIESFAEIVAERVPAVVDFDRAHADASAEALKGVREALGVPIGEDIVEASGTIRIEHDALKSINDDVREALGLKDGDHVVHAAKEIFEACKVAEKDAHPKIMGVYPYTGPLTEEALAAVESMADEGALAPKAIVARLVAQIRELDGWRRVAHDAFDALSPETSPAGRSQARLAAVVRATKEIIRQQANGTKARAILGAADGESLVDAAKRVVTENAQLRASADAAGADWTVGEDGRSNTSKRFVEIEKAIEECLRNMAYALINGQVGTVARVVLARIAHVHGLAPKAAT